MGGAVRADWHLGDLELPSGDPVMIQDMADVIDLSGSEAVIYEELKALLEEEALTSKLWGVECDMKWESGHRLMGGSRSSCFTCQHFTQDEGNNRTLICRIGREQELTVARLGSARESESLDDELFASFVADADAADELVAACL